ncbi:MAG: radical SAM protein [Lachnospiraceae bacterium]|nr:radical SAM protein [Lachnospiraceae bacterium]
MTPSKISRIMQKCDLCPRNCQVDRYVNKGACGVGAEMYAARAALHFWEEPVISGSRGSGAVFFTGCNLGCVYCQNAAISQLNDVLPGKPVSVEKLADIFLRLQDEQGANNINLVTAVHYVPQVALTLGIAKDKGLKIPVVYNTSSYEKVESLKMLDGLVDVYLPDFKYITPELAGKLSKAPDYPQVAIAAIDEMVRQVGEAEFVKEEPFGRQNASCIEENPAKTKLTVSDKIDDKKGAVYEPGGPLIQKGVIVRQLLLPGHVRESKKALEFLHERYGDRIYISIMNQYTPMRTDFSKEDHDLSPLGRKVTRREYSQLVDFAINRGIENGFTQTGDTAESSFIPQWNGEGID